MRRALVTVLLLFAVAGAYASVARASYCTSSTEPVCKLAGGTSSPTQDAAFDATMQPTYTPPSPTGAPSYYTGTARGGIWEAMQLAGQAPVGATATWGTRIGYATSSALLAGSALSTGLWIGGVINRRWISDTKPGVQVPALVTNLDAQYKTNFTPTPTGGWVSAQPANVRNACNAANTATPGTCAWLLNFTTGTTAGTFYATGDSWEVKDISACTSYTVTGTTSLTGPNCTVNNTQTLSTYLTNNKVAASLVNTGFWHYGSEATGLYVYASESEMAEWLKLRPDPANPSTAQPNDGTATIPSYTTVINSTQRQAAAGALVAQADAGDPSGARAENCFVDSTYCPTGPNYQTGMALLQPLSGETYSAYIARLVSAGLVGASSAVQESTDRATVGPDGVTKVKVDNGTSVSTYDVDGWPATSPTINTTDSVQVYHNSGSAPAAATPTEACGSVANPCHTTDDTPPDVGSGSSLTFPDIHSPCGKFPFGVFCWIGGAIDAMVTADPTTPSVHLPSASVPLAPVAGMPDSFDSPDLTWSASEVPDTALAAFYVIAAVLAFFVWLLGLWFVGSRMMVGGHNTLEDGGAE